MDIVDSQVHIWGADTPARPWPAGRAAEAQTPYPISKEAPLFQMDLARVKGVVLVPPSWEGDRNDLALEAAGAYSDRFAVMGRRFTFHNEHNRHLLTDGSADWLWPAAEPSTCYECITLFTEHLPWLKGEDLEWVMGRGVREWLGWR